MTTIQNMERWLWIAWQRGPEGGKGQQVWPGALRGQRPGGLERQSPGSYRSDTISEERAATLSPAVTGKTGNTPNPLVNPTQELSRRNGKCPSSFLAAPTIRRGPEEPLSVQPNLEGAPEAGGALLPATHGSGFRSL